MILLVSQHEADHTTNIVIDWLAHRQASFSRVNGNHFEKANHFQVTLGVHAPTSYLLAQPTIDTTRVKAVWLRRWLPKHFLHWTFDNDMSRSAQSELKEYLKSEFSTLRDHFYHSLRAVYCLGDGRLTLNKLITLEAAQHAGMRIPRTLVTNSKQDLIRFLQEHPLLIVKNIQDMFLSARPGNVILSSLTSAIEEEDLASLPDSFFPSLFQERVEKEFEIRVFYLEGECHAMAIFSQGDPQTALDFRNYNLKRPNRNVPYQLPVDVEQQINVLMGALELNTGSIDLIKDLHGNYIFLEVNPAGQFGMVSEPCNYFLEEKVADTLISHADANENRSVIH